MDILDSGSLKIQYNRNRYYDYYSGRWLTHDPLGITPNPQLPNKFGIIGQYKDGLSLYEYVNSRPTIGLDPEGLGVMPWPSPKPKKAETEACKVTFKGHGIMLGGSDKELEKCKVKVEGMTKAISGPDSEIILIKQDIKDMCAKMCCRTTLYLKACCVGNNESYMKELASGCCKIKRVCGYTKRLHFIPWIEITFPLPWNWNCIDVNTE